MLNKSQCMHTDKPSPPIITHLTNYFGGVRGVENVTIDPDTIVTLLFHEKRVSLPRETKKDGKNSVLIRVERA